MTNEASSIVDGPAKSHVHENRPVPPSAVVFEKLAGHVMVTGVGSVATSVIASSKSMFPLLAHPFRRQNLQASVGDTGYRWRFFHRDIVRRTPLRPNRNFQATACLVASLFRASTEKRTRRPAIGRFPGYRWPIVRVGQQFLRLETSFFSIGKRRNERRLHLDGPSIVDNHFVLFLEHLRNSLKPRSRFASEFRYCSTNS